MIGDFMQTVYRELTPSGTLRAAVVVGTTAVVQRDPSNGELRGLGVDLADELARRLGVPRTLRGFDTAAGILQAGVAGEWDVAFIAAHPARTEVDFTPPYAILEGTYVVRDDSPYRTVLDLDHEGVRIAVAQGAVYDLRLTRSLKHARLTRAPTFKGAVESFMGGDVDAVAGVKQLLAALVQAKPELRIIDGRFTAVEQAIAVQKGNLAALRYLKSFAEEMKASGRVAAALEKTAWIWS